MGIKKKLGLGVASAALGVSLVGGGTWAAFNDVEALSATYAAGTLDLVAEDTTVTGINLSNLKPGDVFEKEFKLSNNGSLAIRDVMLKLGYSDFKDYVGPADDTDIWGVNDYEDGQDFLQQFKISILAIGTEGGNGYGKNIVSDVNLWDFIQMTNGKGMPASGEVNKDYVDEDGRVNVITKTGDDQRYHGLPVDPVDDDNLKFVIEFIDHDEKDENGVQLQNKYQGDAITLNFNFEARQWSGLTIQATDVDEDGYIKTNEKSHSEDGAEVVDPGDGDDNNTPDPEPEFKLVGVTVNDVWTRTGMGNWLSPYKYSVTATATFTFSDKSTLTDTKTVKDSKNSSHVLNFKVKDKDGKTHNHGPVTVMYH